MVQTFTFNTTSLDSKAYDVDFYLNFTLLKPSIIITTRSIGYCLYLKSMQRNTRRGIEYQSNEIVSNYHNLPFFVFYLYKWLSFKRLICSIFSLGM